MPDRPIRIALDERAFRDLCAGKVVHARGVRGEAVDIILCDIGILPMLHAALVGARTKSDEGVPR